MRRKNRYMLNGALIGFSLVGIADVFLQWLEHDKEGAPFSWEYYNGWRTLKRSFIGGLAGGCLGYVKYADELSKEAKFPFDPDHFLNKIILTENLKSDPNGLRKLQHIKNNIRNILWKEFGDDLVVYPEIAGSIFKKTALKSKYDLDIILPFKKHSYHSLKQMYHDVFERIRVNIACDSVCKQTKSIGISICSHGQIFHLDIVPGREINNYKSDRDLNLFVRPDWVWKNGGQFKTNIRIQKKLTAYNPKAREAIKLLKKYRNVNSLRLPSSVIEQYVIKALEKTNFGLSTSIAENFLNSMDFISKKITQKIFLDFANSNHNLHLNIDWDERNRISKLMRSDISKMKNDIRFIKEVFDANEIASM